jgi:hypothetical protein
MWTPLARSSPRLAKSIGVPNPDSRIGHEEFRESGPRKVVLEVSDRSTSSRLSRHANRVVRSRDALLITATELSAMAAAAIIGLSRRPVNG